MRHIFGYARVSTKEQNLERQIQQLQAAEVEEIITDKQTGKTFERRGYNSLVGTVESLPRLREGDLLVICSLDRLGRNYYEIQQQWKHITQELKADIKVLDMPLLDTSSQGDSLDKHFIADLALQILAYVAQKELEANRKRREQGVAAMLIDEDGKRVSTKTGRATGRPEAEYPEGWEKVIFQLDRGDITAVKAMNLLSLKKTTFYRLLKAYRGAGDVSKAQKARKATLADQRKARAGGQTSPSPSKGG